MISAEKSLTRIIIPEKPIFKYSDVKDLSVEFWLNCISCFFLKAVTVGYIFISLNILLEVFNFPEKDAAISIMIPYIVVMIFAPIIGYFVDRVGYHIIWCIMASVFVIIANIIFMVLPECKDESIPPKPCYSAVIPFIFLGFGLTIFFVVSNGTMIAFLVDEQIRGTAFGIASSI